MTDFFSSLKADLLDRRVLPILVVLGVALLGTLAFAVLGGSGSTSAPAPLGSAAVPVPAGPAGVAISQSVPSTSQAVAETTSGSSSQHAGLSRDPFAPLPGSQPAASTRTPSTSKTSGSSAAGGAGSSGGTSTAPASKPAEPVKPKAPARVYNVAVEFGVAPTGTPPTGPPLKSYEKLKRLTPLPSAVQPLVAFAGVTPGGKSASFTLVGEAILRGSAVCVPDASQCQAIDLKPGQSEQLEYLPPSGPAVIYELLVVTITSPKATTASARIATHGVSSAGRELLRRAGRLTVPGLRYSQAKGVLLFAGPAGAAARAAGA